jgi:hypothetical protein
MQVRSTNASARRCRVARSAIALTLIGFSPDFDAAWDGALAARMKLDAAELSRRLGGTLR